MEQLKRDLTNIIDNGAANKLAIAKAKKLEKMNNDNKIRLNADMIEVFELLALIEAETAEVVEAAAAEVVTVATPAEVVTTEEKIFQAIEAAVEQKKEAFEKYVERQVYFTDEDVIDKVDVVIYDKGIYLQFAGTRNNLNVFVDNAGQVIRKPRKAVELERTFLNRLGLKVA